jgi:hypothetical protein
MAGGSFQSQNKIRPGAYIKFQGVPSNDNIVGSRGIVTMAAPIGWGPEDELIKVTVADLYSNKLEKILGFNVYSASAKLFKAALENAHTLLVYRADKGGTKATVQIDVASNKKLKVTAKYAGTTGNNISISIKEAFAGGYSVNTFLGSTQKDSQIVTDIKDLVANDFVTFEGEGVISQTAVNTLLTGGTNGTPTNQMYTEYLAKLKTTQFDTLAAFKIGDTELFNGGTIKEFIQEMRETRGIKCQAVINNYVAANYEGVISTYNQGVKYADGTELTAEEFVVWMAGATAGADVTESNTYKVVANAVEVTGNVLEDDIETLITSGYIIISKRRDGAIVVEKDINTLVNLRDDVTDAFKENKVIRLLDAVANHIALDFEQNYAGKVVQDANGRALFKASIISYLTELQNSGAIINFNSSTDVMVEAGEQVDAYYSEIYIQPTYSVDKLYMIVNVR